MVLGESPGRKNEHEIFSFLLLLRFSLSRYLLLQRDALHFGNDGVSKHGTVVKRREAGEGSPAAEKAAQTHGSDQ